MAKFKAANVSVGDKVRITGQKKKAIIMLVMLVECSHQELGGESVDSFSTKTVYVYSLAEQSQYWKAVINYASDAAFLTGVVTEVHQEYVMIDLHTKWKGSIAERFARRPYKSKTGKTQPKNITRVYHNKRSDGIDRIKDDAFLSMGVKNNRFSLRSDVGNTIEKI